MIIPQSVISALFLLVCGLHVFSGMQKCTKTCFICPVQNNKVTKIMNKINILFFKNEYILAFHFTHPDVKEFDKRYLFA